VECDVHLSPPSSKEQQSWRKEKRIRAALENLSIHCPMPKAYSRTGEGDSDEADLRFGNERKKKHDGATMAKELSKRVLVYFFLYLFSPNTRW